MKLSEEYKKKALLNFFIFFSIVILDQLTKKYLLFDIGLNNSKPFIPGLIQFTVVQNTGGAFSILKQYPFIFQLLGILNVFIFSYLVFCPVVFLNDVVRMGCVLVLGGTAGNLIDRLVHEGVVDFLDFQIINFAVFNFADVFIDIGVALIVIGWVLSNRKHNALNEK